MRQCVQLGELTGHFVSKQDKNISILQQIFAVLRDLSMNKAADSIVFAPLAQFLTNLRITVWYQSLLSNIEEDIDKNVETNLYIMREDLIFPLISCVERCQRFVMKMMDSTDMPCYDLWENFIFFFNLFLQANFFYRNMFDLQYISIQSFELSEETRELRDQVFGSKFLTIWDNLLEAAMEWNGMKLMSLGFPMQELLEIYCDGQLQRTCNVCSADIQVSVFYPYFIFGYDGYDIVGPEEHQDESLVNKLTEIVRIFEKDCPFIAFGQESFDILEVFFT